MDKENKVDPEFHTHFKEFYCFLDRTLLRYTVETTTTSVCEVC